MAACKPFAYLRPLTAFLDADLLTPLLAGAAAFLAGAAFLALFCLDGAVVASNMSFKAMAGAWTGVAALLAGAGATFFATTLATGLAGDLV